jgi:hypothetical protein
LWAPTEAGGAAGVVADIAASGDAATGRAVLAAHHSGLAEASAYLDEHLGARRGHGGVQHVSDQGAAGGRVDHRTSREGDPLVHTYLVVANRVQGPDGRWTALDGRDLCAPVRSTPKSTGSGRTGADTTAGQLGRPRHPQTQAARGAGYPVRPLAPGGGRAWRGPRHSGPGSDPPDT